MENAYAQALWNMIEGGASATKAVHSLRDALTARGRAALLPRIARAFARIAERNSARNDVVLSVSRESDVNSAKKQIKSALEELQVSSKDLKTQIDDTLIGGWRLEGKETLFDNSYKKQLLSVYNRVIEK